MTLRYPPLNFVRRVALRTFSQASRDGHNDSVATAMAVLAALDVLPGLSVSDAYELVTETLRTNSAA